MATVYGIAKQNQGFVNVYSELGRGTTFKIYLPRLEDEEAIINLGRTIPERLGYMALTARTPGEAIGLAEEHAGDIQLLVTDVVMHFRISKYTPHHIEIHAADHYLGAIPY